MGVAGALLARRSAPGPRVERNTAEARPPVGRSAQFSAAHGGAPVVAPSAGSAFQPGHAAMSLGPGEPLPGRAAQFFGRAYGADLTGVRVHRDSPVPGRFGARAVTVGRDVAFAPGRLDAGSQAGAELLGHELAHVVQQEGGTTGIQASGGRAASHRHEVEADAAARAALGGGTVRALSPVAGRSAQADSGPACFADAPLVSQAQPGPFVCQAQPGPSMSQVQPGPLVSQAQPEATMCPAPWATTAPAALLPTSGPLADRIAAFKSLVRTTAILRLRSNQANLATWSQLVTNVIPTGDLAAAGLLQTGGTAPYFELQDIRDPAMRELRANQAEGRYRACTGCHVQTQIHGSRADRERQSGWGWQTPNEQRAHVGLGYRPAPGTAEARLHQLLPDPEETRRQIERARPVLAALGPDGYRVLPRDVLAMLGRGSPDALRCRIRSAITERSEGYEALIGKIRSGDLGYEHFGPIVRDLLPAADPQVRAAIQKEMDDKAFWDKVEAVVVGVLTVGALLLMIFPPTTALGLAAFGALEVGLGVYGAVKGAEMIEVGRAYQQGTGAHDVFTREQQESGGMLVLTGFLGVALAPLAVGGGLARVATGVGRVGEAALLNLQVGQTLQRGRYLMTVAEDGSLVVTLTDRADIMIIVRDGVATAYQRTPGGLRVLESQPLMPAGAGPGRGGGVGTPFEGEFPHVQQQRPNWCGAACGEMSARRLGVEVGQEQVAATRFFEPELVVKGQTVRAGGFQSGGLAQALDEVAPIAGRQWVGGSLPASHDISTVAGLRTHLGGYLDATQASVILRVRGADHWIIVDRLTPDGLFAIRDPGLARSTLVTAEELLGMRPIGEAVFSFPKATP